MSDLVNGLFEFIGGITLWMNVWRTHKDGGVKGVNTLYILYFSSWGWWNLYYYPSLGQWWSFAGGVFIVVANVVWLGQVVYYTRRKRWDAHSKR